MIKSEPYTDYYELWLVLLIKHIRHFHPEMKQTFMSESLKPSFKPLFTILIVKKCLLYIYINAVKWLITINRIQNKIIFYIIHVCVLCIFIMYR